MSNSLDASGVGSEDGQSFLVGGDRRTGTAGTIRALAVLLAVLAAMVITLGFLQDEDANKALQVIAAILVGGAGVWVLYWAGDQLISALPRTIADTLRPYMFIGPAMAVLGFYLVYPAINTIIISLQDNRSDSWVGLDNYAKIFSEKPYLIGLRNSALWVIIVPFFAVTVGLTFATLADRLSKRAESVAKSLIFLPMAISFVGASVVFTFIYAFRPDGFGEQIGLLNAIWGQLGGDPVSWLSQKPWNNLYLMVILIWLQTGFSMVILSSAIKSVPDELLEAARIDGATEWQAFWKIVIPSILSTVVVVWTTVLITVWKVFDIVFVMTGGQEDTQVVAQQMVNEFFTNRDNGVGAALAVVLFIAVVPVLILNIRQFKADEAAR